MIVGWIYYHHVIRQYQHWQKKEQRRRKREKKRWKHKRGSSKYAKEEYFWVQKNNKDSTSWNPWKSNGEYVPWQHNHFSWVKWHDNINNKSYYFNPKHKYDNMKDQMIINHQKKLMMILLMMILNQLILIYYIKNPNHEDHHEDIKNVIQMKVGFHLKLHHLMVMVVAIIYHRDIPNMDIVNMVINIVVIKY